MSTALKENIRDLYLATLSLDNHKERRRKYFGASDAEPTMLSNLTTHSLDPVYINEMPALQREPFLSNACKMQIRGYKPP